MSPSEPRMGPMTIILHVHLLHIYLSDMCVVLSEILALVLGFVPKSQTRCPYFVWTLVVLDVRGPAI